MHIVNEDPRTDQVQKEIVDVFGIGTHKIGPKSRLVEDLGADSLDYVELVMAFEEEFDIEIPDKHVVDDKGKRLLATLQDIYDYLNKRLGPAEPVDGVLNLTEDQFIDRYKPEKTPEGYYYRQREWRDADGSRALLESAVEMGCCWTAIDDDDGEWMIVWGNRVVNRIYNVITSKAIEAPEWEVQVQDPYDRRAALCMVIWDEDGEEDPVDMPATIAFRMLDLEKQTGVTDIHERSSSAVADFISVCTGWSVKSFDFEVYDTMDDVPGEPEVITP